MTLAEQVQLSRAEEQVDSFDPRSEVGKHDPWAIRPRLAVKRGQGRQGALYRVGKKATRDCMVDGCGKRATHLTYCHGHWKKMRSGIALDLDGIGGRA